MVIDVNVPAVLPDAHGPKSTLDATHVIVDSETWVALRAKVTMIQLGPTHWIVCPVFLSKVSASLHGSSSSRAKHARPLRAPRTNHKGASEWKRATRGELFFRYHLESKRVTRKGHCGL